MQDLKWLQMKPMFIEIATANRSNLKKKIAHMSTEKLCEIITGTFALTQNADVNKCLN